MKDGEQCRSLPAVLRGNHECTQFMGLLPEINRAWVSIDTQLYLWNYETGGDIVSYDGLDQIVVSVGLVPPRPGVFQPAIKVCACRCSPLSRLSRPARDTTSAPTPSPSPAAAVRAGGDDSGGHCAAGDGV